MAGRSLVAPLAAGLWALGAGAVAAQETTCVLPPDSALAARGQALFSSRGCIGCHSVGQGKRAGPDLAGVTGRRPLAWLRRWVKDPTPMLKTDSVAKALLAEYNNIPMPGLRLTDDEVEALLHYVARESKKAGAKC